MDIVREIKDAVNNTKIAENENDKDGVAPITLSTYVYKAQEGTRLVTFEVALKEFIGSTAKSMSSARKAAQDLNHEYIGTEHILLGVIREDNGVATGVLRNMGIDLEKVLHEVERIVEPGKYMVTMSQLPFTPRAKKVLEMSMDEAQDLGHNRIGTEHIFLGLIAEAKGIAAQVLTNLGVRLEDARQEVMDHLREP